MDKPIDAADERNTEDKPIQSEKERKLAVRVQELFRAAYDAKNQLGLPELWAKCDDYKHNRQNPKQSEEHPGSVTNIIHPIIESQIADLIDKPYSMEAEGREPSDDLYSDQVQKQLEFVFDRNKFRQKLNISEHDRLELGGTVIKTYFDDDALDGRGLPTFEIVSPANFFPDPKWSASHRLQECEYIIHAVPRPLSWIRRKFPKRGAHIMRETSVPYDPETFTNDKSDEVSPVSSQKALLIECYMKDDDDNLFCVHVANHIILEDSREVLKGTDKEGEPKRLQRRNKFPFVYIPCYTQRGIGWGQGDVEILIPTQDLINDLDDQIRMSARKAGNPQIVVGQGAGRAFDIRKWTSKEGLRIPMRDVNAWKIVPPQNVASDIPIRREKAFEEADRISGRVDVTRGEAPGQVTAAAAIIALQQAGQKSVLHKNEMLKMGWNEVLELLYDEMIENWDEEMWIRVQGDQPDFEFIDPSVLRNIPMMIPNAAAGENEDSLIELTDIEEITDEETGEIIDVIERPMTREAQFDLKLTMGNGLPTDKAFIYQTLLELAKMNIEGRPMISWQEMRDYLREEVGLPLGSDEQLQMQGQPQGMPQGMPMPPGTPMGEPQPQQPPQQLMQAIGGM